MKDEALKAHVDAVVAADEALYDAGFADGVASVPASPGGGVSPEQEAADIAAAVAVATDALHAEVDAAQLQAAQALALKDAIKAKLADLVASL